MRTFHLTNRQAAISLGLFGFLSFLPGAPRLAVAAPPPPPTPAPAAEPPKVMAPPPAAPLPEAANRRHLRYADSGYAEREAASPRTADFRGRH